MITKCKHMTNWLDRMYYFKQDTLRDKVIDAREIDQWRQILNEYKQSYIKITTPKKEEKIDLNKNSRTDKSITKTKK